jgi:hypothetical protein
MELVESYSLEIRLYYRKNPYLRGIPSLFWRLSGGCRIVTTVPVS